MSDYRFVLVDLEKGTQEELGDQNSSEQADLMYKKVCAKRRTQTPFEIQYLGPKSYKAPDGILGQYRIDKEWSGPREQILARLSSSGNSGGVIPGQGLKKGTVGLGRTFYHGGLRWAPDEIETIKEAVEIYNQAAEKADEHPETLSGLLREWAIVRAAQESNVERVAFADEVVGSRNVFRIKLWWSGSELESVEQGLAAIQERFGDEDMTLTDFVRMAAIVVSNQIVEDNEVVFVERGKTVSVTRGRLTWPKDEIDQVDKDFKREEELFKTGEGPYITWNAFLRDNTVLFAAKLTGQKQEPEEYLKRRDVLFCGINWYRWEFSLAEKGLAVLQETEENIDLTMRDLIRRANVEMTKTNDKDGLVKRGRLFWPKDEIDQVDKDFKREAKRFKAGKGPRITWNAYLRDNTVRFAAKLTSQRQEPEEDLKRRDVMFCGINWYRWEFELAEKGMAVLQETDENPDLTMPDLIRRANVELTKKKVKKDTEKLEE